MRTRNHAGRQRDSTPILKRASALMEESPPEVCTSGGLLFCPPSLRSVVAPMGALLYASRWRTHARSIGRLWGRKAPQSRGCPSSPESSLRGAFFCGRKPPIPPKKPLRISPQLITLDDQIIAPTYRSCRSFHYGEVSMCESLHFVARVYER